MPRMSPSAWRQALEHTRRTSLGRISQMFGATEVNDHAWQDLEAGLLQADVGATLTTEILRSLRSQVVSLGLTRTEQLHGALRSLLLQMLDMPPAPEFGGQKPQVWLLVGVNGCGKTTSAAKLAAALQRQGLRVLFAAADTYRAAAEEQLQLWANRLEVDIVAGRPGGDPGAVAYEGAQAAVARRADVLLVDTSGRMHTSHNLMAELQKVGRATGKVIPGAPHRVILVLDATTGQNALAQARAFTQAVGVTEILLAKLDSSAKGGAALAIRRALGLPITYVGLGEGPEDLAPFDAEAYVDALLERG
jgi:fused signal recognition particle receptor